MMYHRVRRKMFNSCAAIVFMTLLTLTKSTPKSLPSTTDSYNWGAGDDYENNVIDLDDEYKFKKYADDPSTFKQGFDQRAHRYTIMREKEESDLNELVHVTNKKNNTNEKDTTANTPTASYEDSVPIELISTTEENTETISIVPEIDLSVIPLSTLSTKQTTESSTTFDEFSTETTTGASSSTISFKKLPVTPDVTGTTENYKNKNNSNIPDTKTDKKEDKRTLNEEVLKRSDNSTDSEEDDVPIFTELDVDEQAEVPEDYYDSKDLIPTRAPNNDAISVIFGLAGSVVESVAERVVPKGIFDLFKRMQKQSEAIEAEKLRSKEENGGLGQFGRGILKTISSGLGKPLSQLMAGVRDIGSLDTDRGFVSGLASSVVGVADEVANVANSLSESFKDRVKAIYPGTLWCGDGRMATARSGELGLFFFTDTCCRQHDACKLFIKSGETKHGLTNTGLFTRSHCSCDTKFRECLHRTNSLISAQIGLTYFNVLGPQCFRKAHPILRCVRRTRITGQKCEEYELDYTKPKMWQWFDNETF